MVVVWYIVCDNGHRQWKYFSEENVAKTWIAAMEEASEYNKGIFKVIEINR